MRTYIATFEYDHGWSDTVIEAIDLHQALAKARAIPDDDIPFPEHYDVGNIVQAIRIVREFDPDQLCSHEEAEWFHPAYAAELAGPELFEAARKVVAAWEKGDLAGAVRELAEIIDRVGAQ